MKSGMVASSMPMARVLAVLPCAGTSLRLLAACCLLPCVASVRMCAMATRGGGENSKMVKDKIHDAIINGRV